MIACLKRSIHGQFYSDVQMPKIAILILQWNRAADTLACIRSVRNISSSLYDLFIIDNGSRPEELALVKTAFPDLIYIENGQNLGFAAGYNQGLQIALGYGADYCLLLNNDTTVDSQLLHAFLSATEQYPEAGVLGAKIYFFDSPTDIWYAGGEVHSKTQRCYHIGCGESDLDKRYDSIVDTSYVCGCALWIKKEVIEKVGLMDPHFFLLWEEIDWCWRIRQAGFRCLFVPQAKVWHKISTSFEGGNRGPMWQYFYFRNRLLFIRKHLTQVKRYRFYATTLFKEMLDMLWTLANPYTPPRTRAIHRAAFRGICDACLLCRSLWKVRTPK